MIDLFLQWGTEIKSLHKPLKMVHAQCIEELKTYLLIDLINGDQFGNLMCYILKGHCHISLKIQLTTEQILAYRNSTIKLSSKLCNSFISINPLL